MINLSCPKCTTELEIDDGFAGGICRCFECGTLMTVPAKAEGQAEILTQVRPDRPDRPDSPVAPASAEPPTADTRAPQPTSPEAEAGATTLVTASGRKVKVSDEQLKRVAVAQRRRVGIRVGTLILIFLVIGGITAAAVVLGLNLLRSIEKDTPQSQQQNGAPDTGPIDVEETFTYDPYANPYLVDKPNLFGMPVDPGQTTPMAIVVDTSFYMQDVMDHVRGMLPMNLKTFGDRIPVQLYLAGESEIRIFPEESKPTNQWDLQALSGRLGEIEPAGEQALVDAATVAIHDGATRVVLICSFKPTGDRLDTLATTVSESDLKLDVIHLGRSSSSFDDYVEQLGGRYVPIPAQRLSSWRSEYRDRAESDDTSDDEPGDGSDNEAGADDEGTGEGLVDEAG